LTVHAKQLLAKWIRR